MCNVEFRNESCSQEDPTGLDVFVFCFAFKEMQMVPPLPLLLSSETHHPARDSVAQQGEGEVGVCRARLRREVE